MIENNELYQEHKAVNFGNSKLIFLFNNDEPRQKTKCIQQTKIKQRNNNNLFETLSHNITHRKDKQNSKRSKQSEKILQKPLTSQYYRRNHQSKPNTSNSSRISPAKTKLAEKQKINIKQNTSRQLKLEVKDLTIKDKNQIANEQKNYQHKILDFFQGVRQLFGAHHSLYNPNIDYLIQIQKNSLMKVHYMAENSILQKSKVEIKNEKKVIKKTLIFSHTVEVPGNRISYAFQNQRAQVIEYITDNSLPIMYDKLIKQNFKSRKYIDQQFCHEDVKCIDNKVIQWTYISPQPQLSLFPTGITQPIQLTKDQLQIPFIKFMVFLFQIDPKILIRLMEPPINNVYSVWLFFEGTFKPIMIDGYFPAHCVLENCQNNLWIAIFFKCICKFFGTYETQILKKITHQQIYRFLFGQRLQIIPIHAFNSSNVLFDFLKKKKKKNKFVVYEKNNNVQLIDWSFNTDSSKQFKKQIENARLTEGKFYILEPAHNLFVYPIRVFQSSLTKFQVLILKSCELKFSFQNSSICENESIYIYYSSSNFSKKKSQLKLQYQINSQDFKSIKLKEGLYKMFFTHGKKKIKQAFQPNIKQSQGNDARQKKSTIKVSLMSNVRIQVSPSVLLSKQNGILEDEFNYYHSDS